MSSRLRCLVTDAPEPPANDHREWDRQHEPRAQSDQQCGHDVLLSRHELSDGFGFQLRLGEQGLEMVATRFDILTGQRLSQRPLQ
jgi:hypothetical protein